MIRQEKVFGFNLETIKVKKIIFNILNLTINHDIWLVKKFNSLCFSINKKQKTIIVVNNQVYSEILGLNNLTNCKNCITYDKIIVFNFEYFKKLERLNKIKILKKFKLYMDHL